jgi:hypothetical protein
VNPADRDLGMDRPISRRDLLHGMGALAVSSLVPGRALADEVLALERAGGVAAGYPPALTGLRGSHVGSFEVAHQLVADPHYEDGQYPHEIGRQRFGRIAIANSDAASSAIIDAAIDQAHRAVGELTG